MTAKKRKKIRGTVHDPEASDAVGRIEPASSLIIKESEKNRMDIGENIARLRRQKGVTQEQLAQAVGVSAPAVSKWETSQSLPDIGLLGPIARYFGITIDDLLLFKRELSKQEVIRLTDGIAETFEKKGHAAGMELCRRSVREYPDCIFLKLKIAGMYSGYLIRIHREEWRESQLKEFLCYAVSLLEDVLSRENGSGRYWPQAKGMLVCYLIQLEEYEKAEGHLRELPKVELNPDELYAILYMQKREYEKADTYSQRNWRQYGMAALNALGLLMRSAWETGEEERLWQLTEDYSSLGELLGSNNGVAYDYRIRLALKNHRLLEAEQWFVKLADQSMRFIGGPEPFTTNPAYSEKMQLRLLENYREIYLGDESYRELRETDGYKAALDRLETAIGKLRRELAGKEGEK